MSSALMPPTPPGWPNPPHRRGQLLESVEAALVLRHYSPKTVEAYLSWVRRFVIFHQRRHPELLGAAEVAAFLSHLAAEGEVSASTQNQALAALLFLYSEVLLRPLGSFGPVVHAKRRAVADGDESRGGGCFAVAPRRDLAADGFVALRFWVALAGVCCNPGEGYQL